MSDDEAADGPRRKHRHDLHMEDHGPKVSAGTTRAIQGLLGLWIALTLGFVVYALVDGARSSRTYEPAHDVDRSQGPASPVRAASP
ncbi:MAG TPA: hypothetical protein VGM88_10210 [Kofleriaceae bacterium]